MKKRKTAKRKTGGKFYVYWTVHKFPDQVRTELVVAARRRGLTVPGLVADIVSDWMKSGPSGFTPSPGGKPSVLQLRDVPRDIRDGFLRVATEQGVYGYEALASICADWIERNSK